MKSIGLTVAFVSSLTACGQKPLPTVLQGSGVTGKMTEHEGGSDDLKPAPVVDIDSIDELRQYSMSYDEETRTLSLGAWIRTVNPDALLPMPGTVTCDGQQLTEHDPLGIGPGYGLDVENVTPFDQLTKILRYTFDGEPREDGATLTRISVDHVVGEVSVAQGMSVAWNGPRLEAGEGVELCMVRADKPAGWSDLCEWGEVGTPNTRLWIDGQVLRVPPYRYQSLEAGTKYRLWLARSNKRSNSRFSDVKYTSAPVVVTAQP